MAMDALKNLSNNVPGWLKQLDEVSDQIDQRQAELAAVAAAKGKNPETKSLRNKGSIESLRPKDDVPMTSAPDASPDDTIPKEAPVLASESSTPDLKEQITASPPSPDALKQSQEAIKAARTQVRQVKRRQRSSSMASAEGTPAAYRARTTIIVYYDSCVQDFFKNLVEFVSSSGNLIRKAKMAAKVAQTKRLAEVDMSEGNEDGDDDPLLSLRYMSTRRGYGPARANNQPPDVYDRLDKSLEIVQSMCEHGAHQFLRDGDCNDEISKVQKQLTEVLEVATEEIERIQREEPELAKETGGLGKIRIRRPVSVRREMSPGLKDSSPLTPIECDSIELEADHNVDSFSFLADEGTEIKADYAITQADKN
ncbi:hypothetical protein B0J13DRAFT_681478 [Dactylonectria estremocensis]|uniref:Uncharacterized protein n=1 Tax=Dactylonectria estremocensis TaxID=1079267 RepID=A0A9P9D9M3_9HYPO|nr:hypothetical protein B0J13DRAFT_681478 [Dactylonectria estremocensis]